MSTDGAIYYDPYDFDIDANPYPIWRRMREEAPLYYNDRYDFYALSRFQDVERSLMDWDTYRSGRGAILELIKANVEAPPGLIVFEDPPVHDVHRGLMSRVFTPKKMNALEPMVREFCARCLDPLVGAGRFDFVADLGAVMPMWTIGRLLGIPEDDQEAIRERVDASLRLEGAQEIPVPRFDFAVSDMFADYIDWRAKHPSDDLMTELLTAEFADETGTTRRLRRDEVLTYVTMLAGAGNETSTRLIGWTGKLLAEHPDQRRDIVENRSLIPNAIEELLRYEPPAAVVARYVDSDVEHYGQKVPKGSAIALLIGSANRDDRRFPDGDRFDIHREGGHVAFGYGIHYCLGAALARLEGRVALDEVLKRFPEWEVDLKHAKRAHSSVFRGWESLPVFTS
jgi:cytochrome P450